METPDPVSILNTVLIAVVGGLMTWLAQDIRKRIANVERRLGATIRGMFYLVSHDRRAPSETREAIEEAMKEK